MIACSPTRTGPKLNGATRYRPGPSDSAGPTRLCRGCSHPPRVRLPPAPPDRYDGPATKEPYLHSNQPHLVSHHSYHDTPFAPVYLMVCWTIPVRALSRGSHARAPKPIFPSHVDVALDSHAAVASEHQATSVGGPGAVQAHQRQGLNSDSICVGASPDMGEEQEPPAE